MCNLTILGLKPLFKGPVCRIYWLLVVRLQIDYWLIEKTILILGYIYTNQNIIINIIYDFCQCIPFKWSHLRRLERKFLYWGTAKQLIDSLLSPVVQTESFLYSVWVCICVFVCVYVFVLPLWCAFIFLPVNTNKNITVTLKWTNLMLCPDSPNHKVTRCVYSGDHGLAPRNILSQWPCSVFRVKASQPASQRRPLALWAQKCSCFYPASILCCSWMCTQPPSFALNTFMVWLSIFDSPILIKSSGHYCWRWAHCLKHDI